MTIVPFFDRTKENNYKLGGTPKPAPFLKGLVIEEEDWEAVRLR